MKSAIETAIQTITHKAMLADDSADAMRFAQAVHNLANALSTLCHAEELQRVFFFKQKTAYEITR